MAEDDKFTKRVNELAQRVALLESENENLRKNIISMSADLKDIWMNIDLFGKHFELHGQAFETSHAFEKMVLEWFEKRDQEFGELAGRANAAFYTLFPRQAEFEGEIEAVLKTEPPDRKN